MSILARLIVILTIHHRHIYTGRISHDLCKNIGWIRLLEEASKFGLVDLLTAIEVYLMNEQEWVQQNILTIHKCAASTASLNKLLAYCNRIMVSHPDIIFKSNVFATLPKETLITLLKSNELSIDEDDIWTSVIQWATKQVPELKLGMDLDSWSSDSINTIKDIITDCIPHIRFFNLSPGKVADYCDLLPRKLVRDLLQYQYQRDKDYKPSTQILPPRAGQGYDIDSVIINKKQAGWISSKIVESTSQLQENQRISKQVYNFTLLYRRSRDGNTIAKFRELCNNKGPTIAVGKVLETEEILGGYNPFAWGSKNEYADTKESFIFALDKNIDKSIASFIGLDSSHAIYDTNSYYPAFGDGPDLFFGHDSCKPYAKQKTYKPPIRNSSDRFEWVDWEVFLVSK